MHCCWAETIPLSKNGTATIQPMMRMRFLLGTMSSLNFMGPGLQIEVKNGKHYTRISSACVVQKAQETA
jgi:hypothetical protein